MSCRNCDCAKCRGSIEQPVLIPFVRVCTCPVNGWWSVNPPPPCPMHGRSLGTVITYSTNAADATGVPQ